MIQLNNEFYVETDSNNYILQHRKPKEVVKDGEAKTVLESDSWYFPTLSACLRKFLDESLKESESIQEVLQQIERVHKTIKNLKHEN